MGNPQSNLNIFICGNTLIEENKELVNDLFPQEKEDIKFDDTEYIFRTRAYKINEESPKFSISWKCFILDHKLDSDLSEKLINYTIK